MSMFNTIKHNVLILSLILHIFFILSLENYVMATSISFLFFFC